MTVVVEMVSDLVCPWCWLGLRRMDGARQMAPDVEVDLYFRPFELDPTIPAEGVSYKDYMTKKFGGVGEDDEDPARNRWRAMREALEAYGEEEDIPFDFNGIQHRPNTVNAHRLVRWAQGQNAGHAAKEALFEAYFKDHRDIGDPGVLADIGEDVGLERPIVEKLLAGDADREAVKQEAVMFQQMGVSGVPTFIANRRVAVQGAETSEKLSKFLTTASAQLPQERPVE